MERRTFLIGTGPRRLAVALAAGRPRAGRAGEAEA